MGKLKCARCGIEIIRDMYMVEKIEGEFVPTHRDCRSIFETMPGKESFETMIKNVKRDSSEKQKLIKKRRGY